MSRAIGLDGAVTGAWGLCMVAAFAAMTVFLGKPLLDAHSFRQTQTAMSAYYMAEDPGLFHRYITPVLGKPWAIPMEVPFYQWLVARFHGLSGVGLDPSGKLVSAAFWLACAFPMWLLLGCLDLSASQRCLAGIVVFSSPLYLYWGRAFLIETTGLFFSLAMAACVLACYRSGDWRWCVAALLFGTAAALCKVTTWAVAVGVAGLLVLFSTGMPDWGRLPWMAVSCVPAVAPIVPAKLWLAWGDTVKAANPLARELIIASSANQSAWNFGSLQQKLDPATWLHIGRHVTEQLLIPLPVFGLASVPLILIAGAMASPKRLPVIFVLLAGFLAGPVVFTNLYFEHSYYWCANGIWLLLAVGVALAGIWEFWPGHRWPRAVALALAFLLAIGGFVAWRQRFLPILRSLPSAEEFHSAWKEPVQRLVPAARTILIIGNDWNPNSLYYAERKGIAFPTAKWIPLPGPQLDESLALLEPKEALGAVVINEQLLTRENAPFFSSFLRKLGMSEEGVRTPFGVLFQALDLKFGGLPGGE